MLAVGAEEEVEILIGYTCPCCRLSAARIHPKGNQWTSINDMRLDAFRSVGTNFETEFLVASSLRQPCIGELCLAHSALVCKMF